MTYHSRDEEQDSGSQEKIVDTDGLQKPKPLRET